MYSPNFTTASVYNISAMGVLKLEQTTISKEISFPVDIIFDKSCSLDLLKLNGTKSVSLLKGKVSLKFKLWLVNRSLVTNLYYQFQSTSYFLTYNQIKDDFDLRRIGNVDNLTKPKNSTAALR